MVDDTFLRRLDVLLNLPAGTVQSGQQLKTLTGWDSLAILEFMVLLDESYGVSVTPDHIVNCKSVDDLAGLTTGAAQPQ